MIRNLSVMTTDKADFIKGPFIQLIQKLTPENVPGWGKMNPQEMVEHVATFFDVSSAKINYDLITPEENLPKYRDFLYSDKQFRENTKAPANIIGDDPLPLQYADLNTAKDKLREAIDEFFAYFKNNPGATTVHPVFGPLDFNEWVLLHYKHISHHLRQFALLD